MATITDDEIYKIRTDVLCNYFDALRDPEIKIALVTFLVGRGKSKPTSQLYSEFLSRRLRRDKETLLSKLRDRDEWEKNHFLTASCARDMAIQLTTYPDVIHNGSFNMNNYFFIGLEKESVSPANGIILNQQVEVDAFTDRSYFKQFFIFMFTKDEYPERFLAYHKSNTFGDDVKTYRQFLKDCLDSLTIRRSFLKQWIRDELIDTGKKIDGNAVKTNNRHQERSSQTKKVLDDEIQELKDIFIKRESFQLYLDILRKVDPPVIGSNNRYILKSKAKGAVVAWYDALKESSKTMHPLKDLTVARVLNNFFKMGGLDERTIRGSRSHTYEKYKPDFKALIK